MPERLDAGPILAILGGAALLISLFLTWFIAPGTPPAIADAPLGTAWGIFETLDLVLAIAGLAAVYIGYQTMTGRWGFGAGWLLAIGLLALLVVVSQIIDPPPTVEPAITPVGFKSPHPGIGAWLALAGSAATAVAGVLSLASLSLTVALDSPGRSSGRRRAAADA